MKLHSFILLSVTLERGCAFVQNSQSSQLVIAPGVPSKTTLFADLLAEEGTWQAYLDEETTGLIYYFDSATGESLWEPPTDTFPEVKLPRKKQRLADELRREYRQSLDLDDDEAGGANWLSGLFERGNKETVLEEPAAVVEEVAEEVVAEESKPSWLDGIASGLKQSVEESATEAKEEPKIQIPKPWFGNTGGQKQAEEKVSEAEPKSGFLGGLFGGKSAAKAEVEQVVKKQEPKPVEKKEGKPKILESLRQPVAEEKVETKKPVEAKKIVEIKKIVETPAPKDKKDPKISGGVQKTPIATPAAKKDQVKIEPIKIEMASNIIPHPAKVMWGGEDAVFTKGRSFGVFDGVSGATKKDGVALYSRTLASEMKKRVGDEGINVQQMTKYLTEAADIADAQATGASTAVVASIGENGFLQALNVGDSCCMVIRDGKIAAKTREISHYWECPYQLSSDSPDRPKDGTKLNVELTAGDIVLMGSDGIFDNVSDDLILDTIDGKTTSASKIAKEICNVARKQSVSKDAVTPYSQQARKRGLPEYQYGVGGKVDDIGCVVVVCK